MAANKRKAKAEPAKKETKKSKTASGSGSNAKSAAAKARSPSPAKARGRSASPAQTRGRATKASEPKSRSKSPAKSKSPAPKKRAPSPSPKKAATPNKQSPGWKKVVSKKEAKATKKEVAITKSIAPVPVEKNGGRSSRSSSRSRKAATEGEETHAKTINSRNETAIDDEQYIQYVFRTGILDQWGRTVVMAATTTAPLFVSIPLLCYLKGDFASSQIGVIFLVIYMSIVIITMLFGLPAVLMQRVMTSTLTGRSPSKSSELEVLCLLLVIITAVSVFMTMKAIDWIN
jgi:hypothetical protein